MAEILPDIGHFSVFDHHLTDTKAESLYTYETMLASF